MDELAGLFLRSLLEVVPRLEGDPQELACRLARRGTATVARPPRAWCLAVRASDTRITPNCALIEPAYAVEPLYRRERLRTGRGRETRGLSVREEVRPHTVRLTSELLARLCHPVRVPYGMTPREVGPLLGVAEGSLRNLRVRDLLHFEGYPLLHGRRGPAVPMLTRSVVLDPSSCSLKQMPDPLWMWLWQYQAYQIPRDIDQTVARHAVYRNFPDRGGMGSRLCFRGFNWLCPGCFRPAKVLFYPLPPIALPQLHKPLARLLRRAGGVGAEVPELPVTHGGSGRGLVARETFACGACHRVRYFTRTGPAWWNQVVSYLTAGLLYGREVPRPAGVAEVRKRAYRPRVGRAPSKRREEVMELLVGTHLTYGQIAAKLGVGYETVHNHVRILYRQYGVGTRQALILKVRPGTSVGELPPLRPGLKHAEVVRRVRAGQTEEQIAEELGLSRMAMCHHRRKMRHARDCGVAAGERASFP